MPSTYRIFPSLGLVHIRHDGHVTLAEARASLEAFGRDPLNRPGLRHLADFSRLVSFESDIVGLIEFQAQILEKLPVTSPETLLVLFAPGDAGLALAQRIRVTWEASPHVLPRLVREDQAALDILGLALPSVAALRLMDMGAPVGNGGRG